MAGAFTDDVKLALKAIALHALRRTNEKLHNARLGRARAGPHVSLVRLHRHGAPTEAGLALLGDDAFNRGNALGTFGLDLGEEHQPRAEASLGGQLHAHLLAGDLFEKAPRQAGEDAAAIAGVGLAAARTAMVHIFEHLNGIEHNLMARHALHISHKTNAAAILLISGIVQTLLFGKPQLWFVAHLYQTLKKPEKHPNGLNPHSFPAHWPRKRPPAQTDLCKGTGSISQSKSLSNI
jgi:hypothetical protein